MKDLLAKFDAQHNNHKKLDQPPSLELQVINSIHILVELFHFPLVYFLKFNDPFICLFIESTAFFVTKLLDKVSLLSKTFYLEWYLSLRSFMLVYFSTFYVKTLFKWSKMKSLQTLRTNVLNKLFYES